MTKLNLRSELENLYAEWLLKEYPDEIQTKDQHIGMQESGKYWEDFIESVKDALK